MVDLAEKYRPRTLAEFVGQPKIVRTLELHRQAGGWGGRAYWITGQRGCGKTTLARIIASELADSFMITELVADDVTSDMLREIERAMFLYGWGKGGRAFIVNEAHGLRGPAIRKLKDLLESGAIPKHVVWVFTTTKLEQGKLFDNDEDINPVLARCHQLTLTNQGLRNAAPDVLLRIAQSEGLDGQPRERYVRLWKEHPDFREALKLVADGALLAD